jgi:hypothetical protein
MKNWKLTLAFAGVFAVGTSLLALAGQVPNPVNAPASVVANALAYWSGTNPQANLATIAPVNNAILATNGSGVPAETTALPSGITIPSTDCPLPTTSSVGCIEAINAVSHEWLAYIDSSGMPHLSQPGFTDLSGSVAFSQEQAIGSGDVFGNATGASHTPADTTLTSLFDTAFANAQGDVLTRGASAWGALAPGTAGQLLKTGGSAANVAWITPAVSDPLSFTLSTDTWGLNTDGKFTVTSHALALANVGAGDVLGNGGASAAEPFDTTLTSLFDQAFCSAQGDIIYRGASTWVCLTPGTAGRFLQTQGASANPQWGSEAYPQLWADASNLAAGLTRWVGCQGAASASSGAFAELMPMSGTLSNLYVKLSAAPGTGNSVQVTVYVNSSSTAITTTISNTNTTGNDLTHSASISAGQACDIQLVASASASSEAPSGGLILSSP